MGTAFGDDKLLAEQHLSFRNGDKSSEDGVWLPMWHGNKNSHTGIPLSPHRIYLSMYNCVCVCVYIYMKLPQERSSGERYNNNNNNDI